MEELSRSDFQFSRPNLLRMVFTINKDFHIENYSKKMPMFANRSIDERQDGHAMVSLRVHLGAKDSSAPFYLEAEIEAKFRWKEMEDQKVDRMLSINAPALLFSYLRPHVAELTGASRYPSLELPFVDFTKKNIERTD